MVAFVDEDVADETAGGAQYRPTATAGGAAVVEALPGELGAGGAAARAVAHVEIGFDGDEQQLAAVLPAECNMRGAEQVDLVPLVHMSDPPSNAPRCRALSPHVDPTLGPWGRLAD